MLKAIGFILVIAGLADLAMWILSSNSMGWTDYIFGQGSIIGTWGAYAMIGVGGWMIRGGSDDGEE